MTYLCHLSVSKRHNNVPFHDNVNEISDFESDLKTSHTHGKLQQNIQQLQIFEKRNMIH